MGTLAWISECVVKTPEEAIERLTVQEKRSVVVVATSQARVDKLAREIYNAIREYNKGIPDINEQILPANPYHWDDIDGCLAVNCVEITADKFKNNADGLAFTGWDYSVLSNPNARMSLSTKAMTTMAMMGYFMAGGK